MFSTLPIIDLTPLRDDPGPGDSAAARAVAGELDQACRSLGFFTMVGHGIDAATTARVFDQARRFFALPRAAKDAMAIGRSPCHSGYVGFAAETLDRTVGGDQKESLDIGVDRSADHREVRAGTPLHGPAQWPDLPGFRDDILAYMNAAMETLHVVMGGLALALDLPRDYFRPLYRDPLCWLRLLHYPPVSSSAQDGPGCGAHTDYGSVTLLAEDAVGGLQVQARDGRWLDVSTEPGTLVVNLGDMIARWTNDRYVSTPHRVVRPADRDRYSLPFFTAPDFHTVVECIPSCQAERPARYSPITAGEYMLSRFDDTHTYRNDSLARAPG